MKLTKSKIDKLLYEGDGKSRCVVWDDSLKGFGCRVYPSGRKAFIISYRVNNTKRLMTIGDYGLFTIEKARTEAQEALLNVRKGLDPIELKDKNITGMKFNELCEEYIIKYAKIHKKERSYTEDERKIKRTLTNKEKCKFTKKPIDKITRTEIQTLHEAVGKTAPYEANRLLALLSSMFEFAKKRGHLSDSHINPAKGIDKYKEKKRDRWVKPDELPKLAIVLDKEENVFIKAAIWLYLLTGLRKNELLQSEWKNVDFERAELAIPDTKAGRKHYVPLSLQAIEILKQIPKDDKNPYIIQGRKHGSHMVNIDKSWQRIRKEAGMEDVRLHDLRRTVGSWLATSGHSLPLIGKVLNHSNVTTTQIYARLSQDPAAQALELHGENIISYASLKKQDQSKKVI